MTIAATTSVAEAARRTWDVTVVGAGPAGAMAAHELARRGLAVLLIDRAAFPRWKVCGCCLNRHALAALAAAGLGGLTERWGAVPLHGIRLAIAGRVACVRLSGGVALSRETFDAALVTAAIKAGAVFLPRTHAALNRGSGIVNRESTRHDPQSPSGPVRWMELRQGQTVERVAARVVLAADGLGGKLVSRAGVGEVTTAAGARIGAGVVAANGPAFYSPGAIFMACGRYGYLGLVRLEDGRLDLAAAFDPAWVRARGGLGRAAAELLAEVGWPVPPDLAGQPWRGTPALTRRARQLAAERLFVLGDAAGYIEPFTGEGMAWALAAGLAVAPLAVRAAERWQSGLTSEWGSVYRRLVGRRQVFCRVVAAVLRTPLLTRAMIHLLARAPILAAPVARYLGERGA
jgi:flavin-dependent dehydrogenase